MIKPEDLTILVVDDEPDVRTYLTMVLQDAGFDVMSAQDGNEALEKVKEKRPDFISLDLVMPHKSGIRFYHELRKNKEWADIPVVIVTAHAKDELGRGDLEEILQGKTFSGRQVYLEKPVKAADFVRMVKREVGIPVEESSEDQQKTTREEIDSLLNNADQALLEKIARELKKGGDS
jgi:CheY-like chemotaxis protein